MLSSLVRKQFYITLNRSVVVVSKLSCSDSSVIRVDLPLKIKDLGDDFPSEIKKEFPKNFIQDLFINKFQEKILEYPQLNSLKQLESLQKQCDLAQKLLSSTDGQAVLSKGGGESSVSLLKTHELTGFKLPRNIHGFGFVNSEFSLMQEALGCTPSLSKSVCENDEIGTFFIGKYGSETQKENYLKKLATGEIVASFAHLESEIFTLLDPDLINTTAELSSDKQNYIISGKKHWVYNAKYSDLFILSANVTTENSDGTKVTNPTLFLISKNSPGVKIHEPVNLIALKNLNICDVTFDKVVVPLSSVLGEVQAGGNVIREMLSKGKLNNGAHCIPIMKELVNMAITHCINNEFFKKTKYEMECYKVFIGEIVSEIYAVESMTYLVTGRLDMFNNSDLFLESLIVKIFASESLQSVLKKCINIIGQEVILSERNWKELIRDSQFYAASEISNDHLRLLLAMTGVQHALDNEKKKNVVKRETSNIIFKINDLIKSNHEFNVESKNVLAGYVHCIFDGESKGIEDGVSWLYESTKKLISAYGEKVFDKHWELKILADMVILIYAETAVLSRASRSYCLGVKVAEADRCIAQALMRSYQYRVNKLGSLLKRHKPSSSSDKPNLNFMQFDKYSDIFSITENLKVRN